MFKARSIKSRFILIATLTFFFVDFFAGIALFFGYEQIQDLESTQILKGFLRFIIPVLLFGLTAPFIIEFINQYVSERYNWKRLITEFFLILVMAILIGVSSYYILYSGTDLSEVSPIHPVARGPILNLFLGMIIFAIYEVWMTIEKNQALKLSISKLEKEQVDLKLNALQQQIDPHFMFNSLNVLSELVHEDSSKADRFIHQFSKVYRYVLELNQEVLVPLEKELEFLESFQYLMEIRLSSRFRIDQEIEATNYSQMLPPLSLQLLVENAIKHNQASKERPLVIRISVKDDALIVENNKQERISSDTSNGLGLKKLEETYQLLGEHAMQIEDLKDRFVVRLPLIKEE